MDRTNFYEKSVVNGVEEIDFIHNTLSGLIEHMMYTPRYYKTNMSDMGRPDMVSYKMYGTVKYWWIIMLVNGIENPLENLIENMILTIPNLLDIISFQKKYRLH